MAHAFNGTTVNFLSDGTQAVFKIKSWSTTGGERADIDVTGAADTVRKIFPGLRSTVFYNFECVYDATPGGMTDADFLAFLEESASKCVVGLLTVTVPGAECAHSPDGGVFTSNAWLVNYDFDASLDAAVGLSLTFQLKAA